MHTFNYIKKIKRFNRIIHIIHKRLKEKFTTMTQLVDELFITQK